MTTLTKDDNIYIPTTYSLKRKMLWWREQSCEEDKGGSFDLELYLDYLSEQDFNPPTDV